MLPVQFQAEEFHAELFQADEFHAELFQADEFHAELFQADEFHADEFQAEDWNSGVNVPGSCVVVASPKYGNGYGDG